MLLKDYFPNIGKKFEKTFFSDICFESSKVKKDNVFFAIKGTNIDGNNFILDAINKRSKIIVTEKKITKFPNGVLIIHSKNVRKLLAEVSFKIYNKKPSNLITDPLDLKTFLESSDSIDIVFLSNFADSICEDKALDQIKL